jgi:hypothetical protein
MPTTTGYINLSVNGNEARDLEATIHYEYERATGDGWHEPRYPSNVTLCAVEVECKSGNLKAGRIDILTLLDADCIKTLEAEILSEHEESLQPDPDYLRDMREEWV